MTDYVGTAGDDHIVASGGPNHFDLSQGGEDFAKGSGSPDVFYMGAAFDAGDDLNGQGGDDILELDGDYSAGVTFSTNNFSIETVQLDAGHDYNIYAVGSTFDLTFDASRLSAEDTVTIDSHAGAWGAAVGPSFIGGAGTDLFTSHLWGRFYMEGGLQASDRLVGGRGGGVVYLEGDYSGGLTLENKTLQHIYQLNLLGDHDYRITLSPHNGGDTFEVEGHTTADHQIILDGSRVKHALWADGGEGTDTILGGKAADHLSGAGGDDKLLGGQLGDTLTGGAGSDRFFFLSAKDSGPDASDLIADLTDQDVIYLKPIDADVHAKGDQAFHLVSEFSGHAGELTVAYDAETDLTTISGDINGDGVADLVIRASGDHGGFTGFAL